MRRFSVCPLCWLLLPYAAKKEYVTYMNESRVRQYICWTMAFSSGFTTTLWQSEKPAGKWDVVLFVYEYFHATSWIRDLCTVLIFSFTSKRLLLESINNACTHMRQQRCPHVIVTWIKRRELKTITQETFDYSIPKRPSKKDPLIYSRCPASLRVDVI